ncbi:Peptidase A1 domain-containing protein [Mycena chlorophos]|uniref:Peptidase A1 domain-containing protein n=1 Tax=Mycena chlorophos TaxID=658473 RepID=A0A8H6S746_MYCCL|nr:Peptidase A1 domain-containing protein [Mycena chlorophos]
MPNLKVLDLRLINHVDDQDSTGTLVSGKGIICSGHDSSGPTSPTEFLRRLVRFQATHLAPEDHVLEYLPASLQSLSLARLPYRLEPRMLRIGLSPKSVLERLKQGHFPSLKILRLWYNIRQPADLENEKELLDFLPAQFPSLQQLELCRRWSHGVDSLEELWDPLPLACALVSQLKELEVFRFDPDLPGLDGYLPFTYLTKKYHETIGRLHVMASAIAKEAPWLKRIDMYSEFGSDSTLYWEMWFVVRDDDGNVELDRPPPPLVDRPY